MKTKLLLVLLMISCLTGFTQVLPIIHRGWFFSHWKEYQSAVDFRSKEFDSTANFKHAHFDSIASFFGAQFDSSAVFGEAQFHSSVNFTGVQFHSLANFNSAVFDSSAVFIAAVFDSSAVFTGAHFDPTANFNSAVFDSIAIFWGASAKNGIAFEDCKLPYYLSLSGIKIKEGNIDLTTSHINKKYGKCLINLVNADIEKIRLRYSVFELYFPDDDDLNSDMKTNTYERLLKTQKDNGFTSSYEKLDKEYAEFKYIKSGKYMAIVGWILNYLDENWWGYGYDKMLIIRNTFLIFILFSIINCIFFGWITNIYEMPYIKNLAAVITAKNVILQRIKTLPIAFFYTGLIFFGLKFSTENLRYKENLIGWRFFNLVYFFVIYLGGLVCLGYMANLILSK